MASIEIFFRCGKIDSLPFFSMSPERTDKEAPKYFTQEDLLPRIEHLLPPDCSWPQMIAANEVIAPRLLLPILEEACDFLVTESGPNLANRQFTAPAWFGYWQREVRQHLSLSESKPGYIHSGKLCNFWFVNRYLKERRLNEVSGMLFGAGLEGHAGHIWAVNWIGSSRTLLGQLLLAVLAFEQDSYFTIKDRGQPFLPLEVRLSMWHFSRAGLMTVSPERRPDVPLNLFYDYLFWKSGARYCFADEEDPYCVQKINRGAQDIDTRIPHWPVEATTQRVEELIHLSFEREEMPDMEFFIGLDRGIVGLSEDILCQFFKV